VTSDCGNGNLIAAIGEAAFMIGLVRNSGMLLLSSSFLFYFPLIPPSPFTDVVALASYAPLFVNVNNRQWNPDAIQFNSSAIAPTPSYYVQQLFMKYTGSFFIVTKRKLTFEQEKK